MLETIKKLRADHEDGFTLIELLVVILIIGILSAIATPVFMNQRKTANDAAVLSDIHNANIAVATYAVDPSSASAPIPTNSELGIIESEGVHLDISGSLAQGYCIQGWHDNGKQYVQERKAVWQSETGGFNKNATACNGAGTGGEMDITPGGDDAGQVEEFTDNGSVFAVSLKAVTSYDGGFDLMGSYTETKNKSFRATLADIKCKDGSIKGLTAPRNVGINFSGNSFVQHIANFATGCDAVSVTLAPLGVSTVAKPITVPIESKEAWSGEKSGSGPVELVIPAASGPSTTTKANTAFQVTAKDGTVSWKMDAVSFPSHITALSLVINISCEDGRVVTALPSNLSGSGSQNIGSCTPSKFAIGNSGLAAGVAWANSTSIDLK